jgi:ankyrin repeat protein
MTSEPKFDFNQELINSNNIQNEQKMEKSFEVSSENPTYSPESAYVNIINFIKSENIKALEQIISSLSNKYEVLNKTDPNMHQHCLYQAVQIPNSKACYEITRLLINNGANTKACDIHGQSPLFYIAKEGKVSILHLFLGHSIDLNETDHFKQTPLFYAARDGHVDCVREMIKNGSNVNHQDKILQTPIFYAAREGRNDICRILVENGANVNAIDIRNQTALFFATKADKKSTVDELISLGALNKNDGRLVKADLNKIKKKSVKMSNDASESKLNTKLIKKKSQKEDNNRITYKLVYLDHDMNKVDMNESDFIEFKKKYPNITHLLLHPEILDSNERVVEELEKDSWQTVAIKILNMLWKATGANLFHSPVDHVKLNIPDYPEIIKHPMDFGTIKKKLSSNFYNLSEDFVKDMEQVFLNCRIYNGVEGYVGNIGIKIHDEFKTLMGNYKFEERYLGHQQNYEEFLKKEFSTIHTAEKKTPEKHIINNNHNKDIDQSNNFFNNSEHRKVNGNFDEDQDEEYENNHLENEEEENLDKDESVNQFDDE